MQPLEKQPPLPSCLSSPREQVFAFLGAPGTQGSPGPHAGWASASAQVPAAATLYPPPKFRAPCKPQPRFPGAFLAVTCGALCLIDSRGPAPPSPFCKLLASQMLIPNIFCLGGRPHLAMIKAAPHSELGVTPSGAQRGPVVAGREPVSPPCSACAEHTEPSSGRWLCAVGPPYPRRPPAMRSKRADVSVCL